MMKKIRDMKTECDCLSSDMVRLRQLVMHHMIDGDGTDRPPLWGVNKDKWLIQHPDCLFGDAVTKYADILRVIQQVYFFWIVFLLFVPILQIVVSYLGCELTYQHQVFQWG